MAHWQLKPPGAPALAAQVEPGPQTLPQVPQFMVVLFEVHAPMHTISPVGHAVHWPLTQFCPAMHLVPQVLQLLGSVATFVQVPGLAPQMTSPVGQAPHVPAAHISPMAHSLAQEPQWFGSVISLAQTPRPMPMVPLGQSVVPFGQTHLPETHAAPWSQMKPQAPQLFGSLVSSTQPAGQLLRPVLQTHAVTGGEPAVWQVEPAGQTLPQVLQLKLSVLVLVQAPGLLPFLPQTISPAGHAPHAELTHIWPVAQRVPQEPQSVTLFVRLSHPSGQAIVPVGQPQTPAVQVAPMPCGHFMPHWLQLAGSVITLVQTLLQMLVLPAGQAHVPLVQLAPWGQTVPHVPQLLVSVCLLVHIPLQVSGLGATQGPPLLEVDVLVLDEVDVLVLDEVDVLVLDEVDVLVLDELVVVDELVVDELLIMPPPLELLIMPPPLLELVVVELLDVVLVPPVPPVPPLDPLLPQPMAACIIAAAAVHISHVLEFIRILLLGDRSLGGELPSVRLGQR